MTEPLNILLLHADDSLINVIRANLQNSELGPREILHARTLAQALQLASAAPVHVILLDLDLPDVQGLDPLITFHLNVPTIPVVAFGQKWFGEDDFDLHRAVGVLRSGAQDCLTLAQVTSPLLARTVLYAIERHSIRNAKTLHTEQLQYSEARFRLLINENADPILVVNTNRIIRFANPAAAVLFGKSREELVGSFFVNAKPVDGATLQVIRSQGAVWAEMRVVETVWQGENVYLITVRDMTTHHHLVNALQAAADRYREFIHANMEGIWRTQLARPLATDLPVEIQAESLMSENMISEANDAMAQMYGYNNAAEIIGHRADLEFSPDRDLNRELYRAFVANGYRLSDAISRELDRFGNSKVFINNVYGIVRDGFLVAIWGTQRDVTDAGLTATSLENARLHARVKQRAEEFAALYDLTRELSMQRDLDSLLNVLVERAMKLLRASSGALALYLPESGDLELRVLLGNRTSGTPDRLHVGQGLFGRVAQTREALILDDYRTWEHRISDLGQEGVSAAIAVPMLFSSGLEGVLSVHEVGETPRKFTPADAQLLTLLATQAAALVHNARLHQETEKRAQQMALLYDAGLTLNSVLDAQSQLDFLTRIAIRSLHGELGAFFQFDEASKELILRFSMGFSDQLPYKYVERVALDAEPGIEAWVARSRLPVTVADVRTDPRFHLGQEHLMSGVWVPIEHDNRLLGVLAVGSPRPQAFDSQDERLLMLYASQAAVALQNARLYQRALQAH
jgi:GAF domain-containing protein/PAS domain-containing protein